MTHHIRQFIRIHITGFALGLAVVGGALALDVASLRHLATHEGGYLAVALLFCLSGMIFARAQAGISVALKARAYPSARPAEALVPIPITRERRR